MTEPITITDELIKRVIEADDEAARNTPTGGGNLLAETDVRRIVETAAPLLLAGMQALLDEKAEWARELTGLLKAAGTVEDQLRAELEQVAKQRDEASFKVNAVALVQCWTNEDGKRFVFADDLRAALGYVGPDGGDQP